MRVIILFIIYIDTDEIPSFFLLVKNRIFIARSEYSNIFFMCEDTDVAMVTNMISQLQESFTLKWATVSFQIVLLKRFCCYGIFLFFIRISTFWKRNYKYLLYNFICVFYKSFSTGILRSVTALIALLCSLENEPKKAVFYAEISSVSIK